ncbi:GMC family oxidoreductase N-terminal domain-containing protein [Chitiniphilus purpureus]|uniref:GMC family oxidoreductase N-terminal domain-containing protein n=1 Tax=Chitiniphilus purpureus TaxID=2981137 RepID=A0ABY6DPJ2_9NEIS|nr:FAD-dependent oxidoreductase [Chitiniphilus sp. CD1]UXY16143.1 GMC family oxidoreductase N-terminal domain-containing protein [Chitiniphilus sp. CD1]
MNQIERSDNQPEFDAIIVGSGTCGATIARALCRRNKNVLLLERGDNAPVNESLLRMAAVMDEVPLGEGRLATMRAIATGGSTGLYFGVVNYPRPDTFSRLGIDLGADFDAVRQELPIAQLPEALLGDQNRRLRESALALGHAWQKNDMLIDLAKCDGGYRYEAKWKARSYVDEAVAQGATLISRATVHKVLIEGGKAVGVEYRVRRGLFGSETRRVYGARIILAAGELASPQLLRDSGVPGIGDRGFYCNPGYAIYGLVPGLTGRSSFVGSMGCSYDEGIELGDANVPQHMLRPMMLAGFKLRHLVASTRSIGIGVKVKDGFGGELRPDGRLHKTFDREDRQRLDKGRAEAIRILRHAGATHITDFGVTAAGRVGGLVRIGEHVDDKLETRYRNLYVCDGSVLPDDMRGTPTLTLVCLARHLSRHLLATL